MIKKINNRPYILIGCLIWVASFFGEAFGLQPYSTIGIIISPLITGFGVIHWFRFYKTTRGYLPKFFEAFALINKKMRKNPFVGLGFLVNHLLEFWTFAIIFWMGLFIIMFLTFGQSDAFKTAKTYCESDSKIIEKTGGIKYYGLLVGGSISANRESGESDLSFTIVGEKGIFKANAELIKYNGNWDVTDLKLKR